MKLLRSFIIFLLFILCFFLNAISPEIDSKLTSDEKAWLQNNKSIQLGVDPSWPPMEMISSDGKYQGIAADYIDIIEHLLGIEMTLLAGLSWEAVIAKAKSGEIDLLPAVAESQEREEYLNFSESYASIPVVIITMANNNAIKSIEDLKGLRVAVVKSYAVQDWLKRDHPEINLYMAENAENALKLVSFGSVDAYIGDTASASYFINNSAIVNLKIASDTQYSYSLKMGVRKDYKIFLSILNKTISEIPQKTKNEIFQKWITLRYEKINLKKIAWSFAGTLAAIVFIVLVFINIRLRRLRRELESGIKARTKELLQLNKDLKTSRDHYEAIIELAADAILLGTPEGLIFGSNSQTSELSGYSKEELLGKTINILFSEEERARVPMRYDLLKQGKTVRNERSMTRKNGSLIPVEMNTKMMPDGTYQTFIRDVTDRKNAENEKKIFEEKIARSEKMEALGRLAGGVAHDLNNILSGIVSYPDLILMTLPSDSSIRKYIGVMKQSGERAAAVVQDLLTLSRRGVSDREVSSINSAVSKYMISPEYEKIKTLFPNCSAKFISDNSLLPVLCSEYNFFKIIMNLVNNAFEAMPAGGTVNISTRNQYIDKPLAGYERVLEGDYAVLSVSDEGTGIDENDLKRIFEPFYTKKVMGRSSGTGLGMSVVYGIIQDHNGYINVETKVGLGTVFDLYFPITRDLSVNKIDDLSLKNCKGKGERILVVDDVYEQREIAEIILKSLGYEVETVSGGAQAIKYFESKKADLLVLDMIMEPGIDGLETYQEIVKIYPKQKAVIVSGFAESDRVLSAQKLGAGEYVRKPYTIEKLGIAVRRELDKAG